MIIYCKGISEESIDFIVERKLQAYIFDDYAIVTLVDDKRCLEKLREYLEVKEETTDYFKIFFSPEMIVPDMKYILSSDVEKDGWQHRVEDFERSFFDMVTDIAIKSENLTRAEALRLIWLKFAKEKNSPYDNVNKEELQSSLNIVDRRADEDWINNKFVELVIKYSIYITCWERKYGYNAIVRYIEGHLANKVSPESGQDYEKSIFPEKTLRKSFLYLISDNNDQIDGKSTKGERLPEKVIKVFDREKIIIETKAIERKLYDKCKLDYDEEADIYRKFYWDNHNDVATNIEKHRGDTIKAALYEFLLFINAFSYWYVNDTKKVLDYYLDNSIHVGDISEIIENTITASTEIVLLNTVKINQTLETEKEWVDMSLVSIADDIQITVLPAIIIIMKQEGLFDAKTGVNVDTLLQKFSTDISLINRALKESQVHIKKLTAKDGGFILGGKYYFATENNEEIRNIYENIDTTNERSSPNKKEVNNKEKKQSESKETLNRAKRLERNYWSQRIKKLKKKGRTSFNLHPCINKAKIILTYLLSQNIALRNKIREEIETLIQKE